MQPAVRIRPSVPSSAFVASSVVESTATRLSEQRADTTPKDNDDDEYDYEGLPSSASPGVHMIAGALAGITEHTVMYPLDHIKTRMQLLIAPASTTASAAALNGPSVAAAIARFRTTEGMGALWRGVSSVVVGAGPAHALYFAAYEKCKELATDGGRKPLTTVNAALTGVCATMMHDALMNPFDVVKQRMQSYSGAQYKSIANCFWTVLKAEGPSAFYVSYPTTLTMSIPFQSIHFAMYEHLSHSLNPHRTYNPLVHISAGGLAGGLAALLTTPLDVCKTMLQTRGESTDPAIRHVRGLRDAARLVYAREGLHGFMRGWRPRVLSHMPATAVSWGTYEYFKWLLRDS
ncbi:Fe(2+) transporter [Sorochytrium milnesiophthora]